MSVKISKVTENLGTLISLNDISVSRSTTPVIENINLQVQRGEIVTVIGPNGAGKSTLIKAALGIIKPDTGLVTRTEGTTLGYVPQAVNIDSTLPLLVDRFLRLCPGATQSESTKALQRVGAAHIAQNSMHSISGGEMRRVLLARALLKNPDLLILDEPTAGVDITGQAELYQLIQKIRNEQNCGILLVSHDLHIVMAATDRVFCLNRHFCCSGAPEQVREHPEYLAIFGQQAAAEIGFYRHHHDHDHNLHGDVCDHG